MKTSAASAIGGTGATLNGIVHPEGAPVTECKFEYGLSSAYGTVVPCTPEANAIPADFATHAVSAILSDLAPATTYHYRVVASGGLGTETGENLTFTTLGPQIGGYSVPFISDTTATLRALVNPTGKATTYHFEYGTTTAYGSTVPIPDASAGAANATQPTCTKEEENNQGCIPYPSVIQQVKGLQPRTIYHFRVVAINADATTNGPDQTFATYGPVPSFGPCPNDAFRVGLPSASLPDCRAYEQATPVDKNGNDAGGQEFKVQASPSGDGITSQTKGGLPGGEGAQEYPIYLSSRDASGWSTQGLLPPASFGEDVTMLGWTPDLRYSFAAVSQAGSDEVGGTDRAFLVRSSASRETQQVTPYIDRARYGFAGSSSDGSKLFFEAEGKGTNLTGNGAAGGRDNLYLYEPESEELKLVGLLPAAQGGKAPPGGSFAGPYDWWHDSLAFGGAISQGGITMASLGYYTQEMHAISADGDKAFFTAGGTGQVYVREGLNGKSPKTAHVSASKRTTPDPGGAKPAIFLGAAKDGSVAFFMSCEKLTDDSTAHSSADFNCDTAEQGQDLYAYDVASHQLTDLTVTVDTGNPQGAEVKGLVGTSDDGSYVYFVANGDLDGDGPAELGDCQRVSPYVGAEDYVGDCNLYAWHDGAIAFVAELARDSANWMPNPSRNWAGTEVKPSRVSADGQSLLLRSENALTSYDNQFAGISCPLQAGKACPQFYLYRHGDGSLHCVTCNPTGQPPLMTPTLQSIEAGLTSPIKAVLNRVLSEDGNRVFFESTDKLVAADVNGDDGCPGVPRPAHLVPSCQDVYEWEAAGTGSCDEASAAYSPPNGGCLYLLSTGTSPDPAFFGDAAADGDHVFIFTGEQLVPGDRDRLFDVYDAGVGAGLAAQNQPPPPPPCEGEACRGAPSAPPSGASAGSASFAGPGDPRPPKRCPKGRVKRRGKCVKPHRASKQHHKRQAKRAGADKGGQK